MNLNYSELTIEKDFSKLKNKNKKEENEKNNIVLTNKNEQLINKYKKLEEKSERDIEKFGAIIKKLKKENVQIKIRKNQLSNDIASLNKE